MQMLMLRTYSFDLNASMSQVFSKGEQTRLTFITLSLLPSQTLMTAKYSRQHFCCKKLRRGRKKYFGSDKLPQHHILCDNFLVFGRLPDCDKLLYLSDLFDGRIS